MSEGTQIRLIRMLFRALPAWDRTLVTKHVDFLEKLGHLSTGVVEISMLVDVDSHWELLILRIYRTPFEKFTQSRPCYMFGVELSWHHLLICKDIMGYSTRFLIYAQCMI